MKFNQTIKLNVIAKKEEPSKDGTKTYKRLAVLSEDCECGMLPCSDEIYNTIETGKTYILSTQYNDQYNSYRVTGCQLFK